MGINGNGNGDIILKELAKDINFESYLSIVIINAPGVHFKLDLVDAAFI